MLTPFYIIMKTYQIKVWDIELSLGIDTTANVYPEYKGPTFFTWEDSLELDKINIEQYIKDKLMDELIDIDDVEYDYNDWLHVYIDDIDFEYEVKEV